MGHDAETTLLTLTGRRGERFALVAYGTGHYAVTCNYTRVRCFARYCTDVELGVRQMTHMARTGCLDSWCPQRYAGPCLALTHDRPAPQPEDRNG